MAKRVCYIHVGPHKSGSTAIQAFLKTRQERLLELGYLVPPTSGLYVNHYAVAWRLAGLEMAPAHHAMADDFERQLKEVPAEAVILSAELMSGLLAVESHAERFFHNLDRLGLVAKIVIFPRHQPQWFNSFYAQQVKSLLCSQLFVQFVLNCAPPYDGNYARWLRIAERHGAELIVRPYTTGSAARGVVPAFASAIGVDPREAPENPTRHNESNGPLTINLARRVLWRLTDTPLKLLQRVRGSESFMQYLEEQGLTDAGYCGLTSEFARWIEARWTPDNDDFAGQVWGRRWREVFEADYGKEFTSNDHHLSRHGPALRRLADAEAQLYERLWPILLDPKWKVDEPWNGPERSQLGDTMWTPPGRRAIPSQEIQAGLAGLAAAVAATGKGASQPRHMQWRVERKALLERGATLRRNREWEDAERCFREILAREPGVAPAWRQLAVVLAARGQQVAAYDAARTACRLDGRSPTSMALRLKLLRALDRERIARWLRLVHRRVAQGAASPRREAEMLVYAQRYEEAGRFYATLPAEDLTPDEAGSLFSYLVMTCRFGAAQDLRDRLGAEADRLHRADRESLDLGLSLLREWGMDPSADFWDAAMERIRGLTAPFRERYSPRRRRLLVCLAAPNAHIARQPHFLGEALACRGVDVTFLYSHAYPEWLAPDARCGVARFAQFSAGLDAFADVRDEIGVIARLLGGGSLLPTMGAIALLRPDAVHNYFQVRWDIMLAALLLGVPVVTGKLGGDYPDWRWVGAKFPLEMLARAYRYLASHPQVRLMANSQATLADWARNTGLPPRRFDMIHNSFGEGTLGKGCDNREGFRAKLGIAADALVVGSVYRITEVKDPMLWVETARRIADREPRVHFLLVGDGVLAAPVAERAKRLGLEDRLTMPGQVHADLRAYYECMDVFLMTSRSEGFATVLLEAQHVGLPVVVPAVGGMPEAVASAETGTVVEGRSPADLAKAVLAYLANPARRERISGLAPRLVAERFSIDAHADAHERLFGWA